MEKELEWIRANNLNASYEACSTHKTCDSCLNSSYACHFCEFDFQCHAIGSPLGCMKGISVCHHLEDCLRKKPQQVGYGPPPSVVIAVLCLIVTITCCFCGISSICSVFMRGYHRRQRKNSSTKFSNKIETKLKNLNKQTNSRRRNNSSHSSNSNSSGSSGSSGSETNPQEEPLLPEVDEEALLLFEEQEEVDKQTLERLESSTTSPTSTSNSSQTSRPSHNTSALGHFFTRVIWLTALLSFTVFLLMFYPRMPDYNVCNRQFEWESILHSLTNLHPKIEYQVLISVINENRFGFVLEQGAADIYHNGTKIGYWKLNQTWEATAGAITDVITPIHIEPPYMEAFSLLNDFRKNALIFQINASITGSITWGSHKIYQISSSVKDIEFLVGAEYDRSLCNCTEFLTPQ